MWVWALALGFLVAGMAGCVGGEPDEVVPSPPTEGDDVERTDAENPSRPADADPPEGAVGEDDAPAWQYTTGGSLEDSLLVGYLWAHQSDGGFTNEGVDQHQHPLVVEDFAEGRSLLLQRLVLTVDPPAATFDHPPQNLNLYLLSAEGDVIARSADENWQDPLHFEGERIELEEPLPAGSYIMQVVLYFGVGAQWPYTLTWELTYGERTQE